MAHVLDRPAVLSPRDTAAPRQTPLSDRASRTKFRKLWIGAVALLLIAAAAVWYVRSRPVQAAWTGAPVQRANVATTVSATGRTQALMTVQVGTQVSGTVSEIYVDFNDRVKKGQIVARLDPSQLQAQLTQTRANLTAAQMSVQSATASQASADAAVQASQANVDRLQALLDDAERNLERTKNLVAEKVAPKRDLETAQTTYAQAQAQKAQGIAQLDQSRAQAQASRSQVAQSKAQAAQAQASVELASVNLEKSVIHAPIDGVIVARNVDVGQTVAASLQAPVLFLIANDLTRMQVLADIDEADVGKLREGIPVTFTVDAYPSDNFKGHISQIRLSPQTVQNVVTYTAVIDVNNPDLKLKPGMTASVTAIAEQRENVLTVPNAALRFQPPNAETAEPKARTGRNVVYRVDGGNLEPVVIRPGLTNGTVTEVAFGDLNDGDQVAVSSANMASSAATQRPQSSPFTPQRPRGGGRR